MELIFEKLKVYWKAIDFSEQVHRITEDFPSRENFGISSQFRRAAFSAPLNIAEGAGRETLPDRRHFYTIGRSSLFECIPIIELAKRLGYISDQKAVLLRKECQELTKMIRALIRNLKS